MANATEDFMKIMTLLYWYRWQKSNEHENSY